MLADHDVAATLAVTNGGAGAVVLRGNARAQACGWRLPMASSTQAGTRD